MGFDQYHEPPDELPAETRTFARMIASLTEEAEAIGWYEQRLAVEPNAAARGDHGRRAGEEFKHFGMDLEFLLRRTPEVARVAAGHPLPGGRHRRARRGGRGGGRQRRPRPLPVTSGPDGSPGDRRPAEGRVMSVNHLLREKAPITEDGWALDRRRGARAPARRARRPAAGRLRRARAAGCTRPPTWAGSSRDRRRAGRRSPARCRRRVLPAWAELRAPFTVTPRGAAGGRPRRGRRGSRVRSPRPPTPSPSPENRSGLPRLARSGGSRGITDASPFEVVAEGDGGRGDYSEWGRQGRWRGSCTGPASPGPTRSRSAPDDPHPRSSQTVEHGGYPLLNHLRRIVDGPIVWAPGVRGAVVVSQRGGGGLPLRVRPGSRRRLCPPRRRDGRALPGGDLLLPDRHQRGRGRARSRRGELKPDKVSSPARATVSGASRCQPPG